MARRYSTYFLYPVVQAVGAKSRVPNNQNANCTHSARAVARYLANRGHIGLRRTMNNKLNAITLRLTLTVSVNPNCGFSCPLTLQLLLQILPQVARFILLDQN